MRSINAQDALDILRDKLEYLLKEEALAVDASAKFKLKYDIRECKEAIERLESEYGKGSIREERTCLRTED